MEVFGRQFVGSGNVGSAKRWRRTWRTRLKVSCVWIFCSRFPQFVCLFPADLCLLRVERVTLNPLLPVRYFLVGFLWINQRLKYVSAICVLSVQIGQPRFHYLKNVQIQNGWSWRDFHLKLSSSAAVFFLKICYWFSCLQIFARTVNFVYCLNLIIAGLYCCCGFEFSSWRSSAVV